jgi:hypothetical protein
MEGGLGKENIEVKNDIFEAWKRKNNKEYKSLEENNYRR